MGLAIERYPAKANEISALMVMAIVGDGIVSALLGFAQSAFGPVGIVATPISSRSECSPTSAPIWYNHLCPPYANQFQESLQRAWADLVRMAAERR